MGLGLPSTVLSIIGLVITLLSAFCSLFCCLEGARSRRSYHRLKRRFTTTTASVPIDNPLTDVTSDTIGMDLLRLDNRLMSLENIVLVNQVNCSAFHTKTLDDAAFLSRPPGGCLSQTSTSHGPTTNWSPSTPPEHGGLNLGAVQNTAKM